MFSSGSITVALSLKNITNLEKCRPSRKNTPVPGKQGHVDKDGAIKEKTDHKSSATDVLLDSDGKVGKLYGAKTTPHMFIIDKNGKLVYQGAIDDKADTDRDSIPSAKNYVS